MSAATAEYPQIRPMFADALKAMAEGETEAEKQIVYVLNEARAALPCPSFVAGRALYVLRGGEAVGIVSVATASACFEVTSMIGNGWEMADGTLALARAVARALKSACVVIAQAAMEAGPKVRTEYNDGLVTRAEAVQMFSAGFAGVSPGPVSREVAPGETVKSADVLVLRARSKVLEMRRLYSPGDSDFNPAQYAEDLDKEDAEKAESLGMAPAPKPRPA